MGFPKARVDLEVGSYRRPTSPSPKSKLQIMRIIFNRMDLTDDGEYIAANIQSSRETHRRRDETR